MSNSPIDGNYHDRLRQEGEIWGKVAEAMAAQDAPDWQVQRQALHNLIVHARHVDAMLEAVQPGMQALDLGCGAGELTVALARRGAHVLGIDISARALEVARGYYASVQSQLVGTASYEQADLNTLSLPTARYDRIVIKGALHHLVDLPHLVGQMRQALRPDGLLWVQDSHGDESRAGVLMASVLMFVLPTHVSYGDKVRGLLRFGLRAPSRIKLSMEAEGLSPFEGAGRDQDWLALIQQAFDVIDLERGGTVTGYLAHQLRLPRSLALPLLRLIYGLERLLLRLGLLRSSGVVLLARSRPRELVEAQSVTS
ncbi:MAG: methyltransferase domain-containing protein [Anaerolineae bacterium]|nr:methyltransferase domain-containing protein [Anaerolineae bacterium]MDW8172049.1 methyltransferase domain-containing protein [Anaerolineae bacterium]